MKRRIATLLACGTLTVAGCVGIDFLPHHDGHADNSSSLVDFLYPDGRVPAPTDERPQLKIPLRVGLAFLPATNAHQTGLDVLALVSFDQETHLDDNDWSLAYLTIVGAYVVKGSRHDVATLVDLAVVDPQSRQLIIRAGGTDLRHGNTTWIDAGRETREADITGFSAATDQMIEHFDAALSKFEADVRSGTAPIRVVSKNATGNAGGGGALSAGFIGLLLLAVARRAASQP
jgi:hypothetical protein